jgi:glycolate oxidase
LKDRIINKLQNTFGKDIFVTEGIPERFSYDESTVYFSAPEAVFLPGTSEQIAVLIRLANEYKIPLVPRGLGTGVCGGCVAVYGGIVVSLEKMKKVLDLDGGNMCVTVEAGICNGDLKIFLEERGYYYPPDPQSYENSSIGGNIATNAGGPRAMRYGTTKDYVLSLDVMTGSADFITTGGKVYKYSSGYNLNELFCGSEGTLGIVTRSILKILPAPQQRKLLFIPFSDISHAASFLKDAQAVHLPFTAIEFIDDTAKYYVELFLDRKLPHSDRSSCYLFAELEADSGRGIPEVLESLVCKNAGIDVFAATDKYQEERLWEARRKISDAFKSFAKAVYKADVVVPKGAVPAFIKEIKSLSNKKLPVACFGHVGDGNVHVNLLDIDGDRKQDAENAMLEIMELVKKYGGFPSGEHGIGVAKKVFLKNFFSRYHIDLWRKIKDAFDPRKVMNPGKILE